MEKRESTSFTTTPSNIRVISNFANLADISYSEYVHRVLEAHIKEKNSEFMLLANALGIQINDINVINE